MRRLVDVPVADRPRPHLSNKTGTGAHGATNDVAIAWPPGRRPVLVAAYLGDSTASIGARNAALADVARAVAAWVEGS